MTETPKIDDGGARQRALEIMSQAHWILSGRLTMEVHSAEASGMLVKTFKDDANLGGRILRAIKTIEELYPELAPAARSNPQGEQE